LQINDLAENIAQLRLKGYGVDSKNDPALEIIPEPPVVYPNLGSELLAPVESTIYQEWDSCTICHRTSQRLRHEKAKLVDDVLNSSNSSYIDYFLYCLHLVYLQHIFFVETNKKEGEDISWGEFLGYIGLWLLMCTMNIGCDWRSYW